MSAEMSPVAIPAGVGNYARAAAIIAGVATRHGYTPEQLTEPSGRPGARTAGLAYARQVAMFLCRQHTDLSLPAIGRLFGGRHHTTVFFAERKIRALVASGRVVEGPAIR